MRILVAEDDAVSRRLLQSYLERWGHEVVTATDGEQAWALFQDSVFPILITDWMMPGIDGVELIRRVRAAAPSPEGPPYVYAILLTAKSEKEDLVQAMEAGADDFVAKPFDRDELRARLREGERIIQLEYDLQAQHRALQEAQAALMESERLAGAGKLAAEVAQELGGPLAELTAGIEQIRRDTLAAVRKVEECEAGWRRLLAAAPDAELPRDRVDFPALHAGLEREFQRSDAALRRVEETVRKLRDLG